MNMLASHAAEMSDFGSPSQPADSGFSNSSFAVDRPRLAAIVFTDVVGYSARMQKDERETIEAVQSDFERMRQLCALNGGEVLNTMGDGMMLCFEGAVQAMKFALEMQAEFGARNAPLAGKGLTHRVGVHIGDVYRIQGGHIAGDGVNIAARLEPKAAPGGIAISQFVYDTVKGKVDMKAERMGPQTFKNIAEPMVVWRVGTPAPDTEARFITPPRPIPREEITASSWPRRLFRWTVYVTLGFLVWNYSTVVIPETSAAGAQIAMAKYKIRNFVLDAIRTSRS